jgi:hypothetical protein
MPEQLPPTIIEEGYDEISVKAGVGDPTRGRGVRRFRYRLERLGSPRLAPLMDGGELGTPVKTPSERALVRNRRANRVLEERRSSRRARSYDATPNTR